MYDPIQDGIEKTFKNVIYKEDRPSKSLSHLVHNYWELKTEKILTEDFIFHAVPDACVNILFNQKDINIAGITALRTKYEPLNLGTEFHYVGIQLFPGVWQGDKDEIMYSYVGDSYTGSLPLVDVNHSLSGLNFNSKTILLSKYVESLIKSKLISENKITHKILSNLDAIHTVQDMADITHLSARQLQRNLKKFTGFSPHDFLKVIRLQKTFKSNDLNCYTDQSHFIRSFKAITGYTPKEYYNKYDV